ncbi:MAG: copper chaperone PCu(A)C [Pseudomonadota bacterium]
MTRLLASTALFALAAACAPADTPTPGASETGPVLSYTDAFIMEPIGGRDITMGGVTLSVEGGDVRLTSASSPSIGTIELHTMAMNDGKMQMRQVEGFDLADGETLTLARGGDHLMMFNVSDDVAGGETVDITLNFDADGEPMTLVVEADVRVVGE